VSENVVSDYGWTTAEGPPSLGYIWPRIVEVLRPLGVTRVLDLGAGNGALCGKLKSAGYQVTGVEFDKKGIEIARAAYPAIRFYNFGIQDDPAKLLADEAQFDAVVSTEVIEHLFAPHLLPIYARAALKPKGYLVITTPYHGYLKNLVLTTLNKWDAHHMPLWHGGHIKFWSRRTLAMLLAENGFRVIGFSGVGRVPYLWKSMVLLAQKETERS
jgi:2-polyprenyl-3-methyl-5-hydroxy-6-metoxy-1,4-benzoquinol methylase